MTISYALRRMLCLCLCLCLCLTVVPGLVDAYEGVDPDQSNLKEPAVIDLGEETARKLAAPAVLDDVIVTARKRPLSLSQTAASIGVIEPAELDHSGADSLRDYLNRIPGVGLTEMQPDFYRISVRGMQTDAAGNTTQTTGLFIDDIPLNDVTLVEARPDLHPFDLARIELSKGPQGTLYGGSALAGALRYSLTEAKVGEWEQKSFAGFEEVSQGSAGLTIGSAVNMPVVNDSAGLRLVGVRTFSGGLIDDLRSQQADTDSMRSYGVRALMKWHISDQLSMRGKLMRQSRDADDVPQAENDEGRLQRERALRSSPSQTSFNLYSFDLQLQLTDSDLLLSTAYVDKFSDLSNAYGARTMQIEDLGQPVGLPTLGDIQVFTHELRWRSALAPRGHRWTVGLFSHRYQSFNSQLAQAELGPTQLPLELLRFKANIRAQEIALFGEATYVSGFGLDVTVGGRLYQVRSEGVVENSGILLLPSGSAENSNQAQISATGFNPRLDLLYQHKETVSVYGSISRGFRFGGIQILGATPLSPDVRGTYDSDSVWSYELGYRERLFGQTVQLSSAVFYNDWKNPQLQTTTGGLVPFNIIDNVGGARSFGTEVTLNAVLPVPGLSLTVSAALTDAKTTKPFTAASGAVIQPGAKLVGTPKEQFVARFSYQKSLDRSMFDAGIEYTYIGEGVSDILQSMPVYDYGVVNIHMSWMLSQLYGSPQLSLGARNLADERAVVSAFVLSADNFTTIYNPPRTIFARLSWHSD